jgi:2-keto-4-pentenoate hydratase/2-oxohepta-3-ene-1,7-dioic acid hydratase in catechol pathway
MRLLTFYDSEDFHLGILVNNLVLDVKKAADAFEVKTVPVSPGELFGQGHTALDALNTLLVQAQETSQDEPWWLEESELALGPCVPNPGKIVCVGLNYSKHAAESGAKPPTTPVLFSKFTNTIAAPNESVPLPSVATEYDYEAELVIVIGRTAKHVSVSDAPGYILGYCNGNDISARDLQMLTGQWLLGKTLDRFMPIGPYLVTSDEIDNPQNLPIRCWLNDELRQDSNTADMIFSINEIVSYVSQHMTLEPGDIISTGTPEGVILGMQEKNWMKPGDVVTVEVEGLGRLKNTMTKGN